MSRRGKLRLMKLTLAVGYAACFFAAAWMVEGWQDGWVAGFSAAGGMLFTMFVLTLCFADDPEVTAAVRYHDALTEISRMPVRERNPDGEEQAADSMRLVAEEALK